MRSILRHLALISISCLVTWLLVFYRSAEEQPKSPAPEPFVMALTPMATTEASPATLDSPVDPVAEEASAQGPAPIQETDQAPVLPPEQASEHASEHDHEEEPEDPGPPPPEAGSPDGTEGGELATEQIQEKPSPAVLSVEAAMSNEALLSEAEQELAGETRKGFGTVFLATAGEQLAIGRYFQEPIVLVPKSALDPDNPNPHYFRIRLDQESPAVERILGKPPLEQFRQYRDLFSYPYDQLPDAMRELRRTVLARNEVFLFGALIPPSEWALAIDRRGRSLLESGRELSEVSRFVLRYISSSDGSYDLQVDTIHFSDGTRFTPVPRNP